MMLYSQLVAQVEAAGLTLTDEGQSPPRPPFVIVRWEDSLPDGIQLRTMWAVNVFWTQGGCRLAAETQAAMLTKMTELCALIYENTDGIVDRVVRWPIAGMKLGKCSFVGATVLVRDVDPLGSDLL